MSNHNQKKPLFTVKQGQYLAFINMYIKLNKISPAHTDFLEYFQVTPPTVNQMLKTLEAKELISRKPKTARSIELMISAELLPPLK